MLIRSDANYYNENEPFAAQWLRNLIEAGHIPAGHVDERSIEDVKPEDLKGFTQCHFFAGIAGWSEALRLAGWPSNRPVWTGSCPCQPLSSAGQRKGHADKRHLWPAFQSLISESKPPVVFGEQVASKDGREWSAAVRTDLEELGYACGCADLAAASVGAPHIRQRLFWVADSNGGNPSTEGVQRSREHGQLAENGVFGGMADGNGRRFKADRQRKEQSFNPAVENGWPDVEFIECADGKARPTQPGLHPLADGVQGRVGQLRAYGNAIVPQVAAEFIAAYMEI